ncbi:MAG: 2TM domain-containing protein [Actinomycetota bacterium]|nr:2TM domain-containing protein [Actinomycetota bacterium]
MDVQRKEQRYPRDEVGEIIDLAARLDELVEDQTDRGLTLEQLVHVAEEVGISRQAVERAVVQERKRRSIGEREARKRVRRRMRFVRHAMVYALVVSALLLIDVLNGGGWWFFYVAALWGAVLALQAMRFMTRKKGPIEQAMLDRET